MVTAATLFGEVVIVVRIGLLLLVALELSRTVAPSVVQVAAGLVSLRSRLVVADLRVVVVVEEAVEFSVLRFELGLRGRWLAWDIELVFEGSGLGL